ncbi:MAG: Mur ligase domain-containing protein, partial [Clostridiales bacterium]|nr:Mur ligase domain-containing protein [Clostridiales bacterium]
MVNLVLEEVNKAIGGRALREGEAGFRAPFSVSTDTRTLKAGEVFFALKGERYDAHRHLADAAARGAQAIVCTDAANVPEDYAGAVLLCADTERALGDLAAAWRARVNPFV